MSDDKKDELPSDDNPLEVDEDKTNNLPFQSALNTKKSSEDLERPIMKAADLTTRRIQAFKQKDESEDKKKKESDGT